MSVLELNHVKKSFNNGELEVLQDISLSVEKGEVLPRPSLIFAMIVSNVI